MIDVKKLEIWKPMEWEDEAVDFCRQGIERLSKKELIKYVREAEAFIFKTMMKMELRPRRSFVKRMGRVT